MSELLPSTKYDASHNVGHEAFFLDVYRLLSHLLASKEMAALVASRDSRSVSMGRERPEISRLLINIASYYRVKCDDGSWEHAPSLQHEYAGVGLLTGDIRKPETTELLEFREGCNKIIHASRVHFDGDIHPETGAEYLNPIIYLYGTKGAKDWKATLDVIEFCKAASNVIV